MIKPPDEQPTYHRESEAAAKFAREFGERVAAHGTKAIPAAPELPADLEAIRQRAEKAKDITNGHAWNQGPYYKGDVHFGGGMQCTVSPFQSPAAATLAAYIAAVDPTTVLSLLSRLAAAEALLREARAERDRVMLLWKHERQLERERVRKLDAALDAAGVARERLACHKCPSVDDECDAASHPVKPVPLTLPERLAMLVEARDTLEQEAEARDPETTKLYEELGKERAANAELLRVLGECQKEIQNNDAPHMWSCSPPPHCDCSRCKVLAQLTATIAAHKEENKP